MDTQPRNLLPLDARPLVYTLKLQPHFAENTFSGAVEIRLVLLRPFE